MAFIHPKVSEDLEFHRVLNEVEALAMSRPAREKIRQIAPQVSPAEVMESLRTTDEYLKSLQSGNTFPAHRFEPFGSHLEKLKVKNYFLEPEILLSIANAVEILTEWKKFFKNFKEDYPLIYDRFSLLDMHPVIPKTIRQVIDREGQIKDTASPALSAIRREIRELRIRRNEVFRRALKKYERAGYLDEIKESIAEGRPVLAVKPAYRKKIDGNFAGTSRTGNMVFIEPRESAEISKNLLLLEADEQTEIIRILRELTAFLLPYTEDLRKYENFLIEMDVVRAKALYAHRLDAVLPHITGEEELFLKRAFHPLLLEENKAKNLPVIPQDIHLTKDKRIMVISGPNAGGKSITLKTVGLLQLMLQSGLLVPVHPGSRFRFFEKILTDIGDHQSIENQLSTYSYRLRNMRLFLRLADRNTLFLIDEFGTGSDPELGGALAEVFLEEFVRRGAFGVVTTHYNNLKILAEKLKGLFNAHMEFDLKNMEPTYHLITGDAGSSYTFEVAGKMGIPYSLINRAKKKVHRDKVKYDRTLAELQDKKKQISALQSSLKNQLQEIAAEKEKWEQSRLEVMRKLEAFRILLEEENHKHRAGEKIIQLFKKYAETGDKKNLWKNIMRWLEKEYIKQEKKKTKPEKGTKINLAKVKKEVLEQLKNENVREKLQEMEVKRMPYVPRPGDRVRVKGSEANATLEKIEKNQAVLDYGKFKARVPVHELELVMRKKN